MMDAHDETLRAVRGDDDVEYQLNQTSKALAAAKAEIEKQNYKLKARVVRLTYALNVCRGVLILQQLSDTANGKPEAAKSCQPFIDLIDETLGGPSSC